MVVGHRPAAGDVPLAAPSADAPRSLPGTMMFVVFDLLAEDGGPLVKHPYLERRSRLEAVELRRPHWAQTPPTKDRGTRWRWACDRGIEGIDAKWLSRSYRPGERIENRDDGRYPLEVGAVRACVARGPSSRDAADVDIFDPFGVAVWGGRWMLRS